MKLTRKATHFRSLAARGICEFDKQLAEKKEDAKNV